MSKARVNARALRNNSTDAERLLWSHLRLRQLGGHKFRRQQPLRDYIVDFVCLEKRVVVEVDGGQHSQQQSYDAKRDAWLKDQGFVVLRFWDHEVLTQVDDVKEAISKALSEAPSLILPRAGGEKRNNARKLRRA